MKMRTGGSATRRRTRWGLGGDDASPLSSGRRRLRLERLEDRCLLAVAPWLSPFVPVDPLGSLIYRSSADAQLAAPDQTDSFTIDLDPGQTIGVVVDPDSALQPTLHLLDPNDQPIGQTVVADTPGSRIVQQAIHTTLAGTYTVTIGGASDTVGAYTVDLILNAAVEEETHEGPANDEAASAQDIDASFIALGDGSAQRGAVLGSLPSTTDVVTESEDFESGTMAGQWTTYSSLPEGRIQVTEAYGAADGSYALLMDCTVGGPYNLNEAIWTVDLSSAAEPTLSFFHAEWGDEQESFNGDFTDHYNADGVAISDDGANWHPVWNAANQNPGEWQQHTIYLDVVAAAAGMTLGPNFRIKFQQYDDYPLTDDGRGYDQIAITTPVPLEDWYRFSLDDGQSATLALASQTPDLTLELYDAGLERLAAAVAAKNVYEMIGNFLDTTDNAVADTYFARVTGAGTDYSLVVTRNADFVTEPNSTLPPDAQDITATGKVLGMIGADAPAVATFAAIGDYGSGNLNEWKVARMVNGWNPDFVITTGDNNFGGLDIGDPDWANTIGDHYGSFIKATSDNRYPEQTSSIQRFFPTVGNHDSVGGSHYDGTGGSIAAYLDYLHDDPAGGRLPDGVHTADVSYYDFQWGPIHFFAIDSDHAAVDSPSMAAQMAWLEDGLANSEATWNFVFFHHAPYVSSTRTTPRMRWPFQQWGADAVFTGHHHVYERILLDNIPYFVTGLGGGTRYSFGNETPGSMSRYNASYGSMRVTVDGGLATFEFLSIVDGASGSNGGSVIDTFTMDKSVHLADAVDDYSVEVNAGDVLTVETSTPGDGPFALANALDPTIELYDPTGTLVADGHNALVTYTAGTSGTHTVRVAAAAGTTGEYVLAVSGYTGDLPALKVAAMDPADGAFSPQSSPQITIDFNHGLRLDSLDASDLTVGGAPASALRVVDGDTVVFDLPALSEGSHQMAITAGAILDLQSTPIEPYSGTLTIDTTAPRVTASSIEEGQTVTIAAGDVWQYTARFDEDLLAANLDPSDVTLIGDVYATYQPDTLAYDPVANEVAAVFSGLVPDNYTLTLRSGNGHFEDPAGNDLDGEPVATTVPSGDGNQGGDFTVHFTLEAIGVVDRHVFYNNSALDDPGAGAADDDAIAPDKTALLPGQTATFANYTSYSRGINGIVVDIAGLPGDVTPTPDDFEFRVGNDNEPGGWAAVAVEPTVALRRGAGTYGSDRVTIVLPDYAIRNTWLEVRVSGANLGLPQGDVFYLGNAVAEAGDLDTDARVNTADLLLARNNPRANILAPADITLPYDFDRDGQVDAADVLLARNNRTSFLDALQLLDLTGDAEEAQESPSAELAWLTDFNPSATRRPARNDAAAEAVDQLLAVYLIDPLSSP
ncbi:MAG: metallophosphoesterase [Candidatus Nealsonbacteria bacterium]|nr:metallophosphoesterase [Candidatus Nealsonbacteria bacterium]